MDGLTFLIFSDIKDAENAVKLARQTYHGQFARHQ